MVKVNKKTVKWVKMAGKCSQTGSFGIAAILMGLFLSVFIVLLMCIAREKDKQEHPEFSLGIHL